MASPFDFSSFLLTPPIPGALNDGQTGQGSGGAGTRVTTTTSSQQPQQPQQPQNDGSSMGQYLSASYESNNGSRQAPQQQQSAADGRNQQYQPSQQYQPTNQQQHQQQLYGQQQQQDRYPQYANQQLANDGSNDRFAYTSQDANLNTVNNNGYGANLNYAVPNQPSSAMQAGGGEQYNQVNNQQHNQQQQNQHLSEPNYQQSAQQHISQSSNQSSSAASSSAASKLQSFDDRDFGLDPSAFSNVAFQMPSFLSATIDPSQFGIQGVTMVDPQAFHNPQQSNVYQPYSYGQASMPSSGQSNQYTGSVSSMPTIDTGALYGNTGMHNQAQSQQQQQSNQSYYQNTGNQRKLQQASGAVAKASSNTYRPDTSNPVYGIYGSSVISINPDSSPFKLQLNSAQPPYDPNQQEARGDSPDFDPKSLGLPIGNKLFPQPLPGLYSTSGFDMLGVLARVVARPNPQINIGPVDTSCSFLVVDARRYDMPIVFASTTFSELTGYNNAEIIGRNCRFLQAPDGHVALGSRRRYTDGNAVYHLKTHISSGKESQASIINYRKDGSPFINLVTVIPITWDTDEIAYFVGFQVDLVEQPNAILEKMRNGTYVVNYSLLPTTQGSSLNSILPIPTEPPEETLPADDTAWSEQKAVKIVNPVASSAATVAAAQSSMPIAPELLEVMGLVDGGDELDDDAAKKKWNKMLLDNTGDFVHVLSLKGSFLYVSPSIRGLLEYEPSDLIGKTLQSVCHPSDIVPVMRELKEASTVTHPIINLLYRFRRKRSGYVWLEAQGKLYLEQSKSRKCVILVGRERPVYKISWQDLKEAGGLGEKEFWSKISPDGMFLYCTPTVKTVLGHDADDLRGRSMFELVEQDKTAELTKALQDATAGRSVRLQHKLRSFAGNHLDVITSFFPNSAPKDSASQRTAGTVYPSVIAQTNELSSEMRRRQSTVHPSSLPKPYGVSTTDDGRTALNIAAASSAAIRDMIVTTEASDDSDSAKDGATSSGPSGSDVSAPSTFSAIPSTYKTLVMQGNTASDNIFDELDTIRSTSWQYELHQLKLTNKKLKEELHMLQAAKRKRKKKTIIEHIGAGSGSTSAPASPPASNAKACANCGRTDSPEWRVGPTGQRNLCNACGLRWAKATRVHRQNSATPSTTPSSGSGGSDMDTAASYLQAIPVAGPFGLRPPLKHAESSQFNP